eukprot:6201350-Pleurochrysis_carterae.AAC.2
MLITTVLGLKCFAHQLISISFDGTGAAMCCSHIHLVTFVQFTLRATTSCELRHIEVGISIGNLAFAAVKAVLNSLTSEL